MAAARVAALAFGITAVAGTAQGKFGTYTFDFDDRTAAAGLELRITAKAGDCQFDETFEVDGLSEKQATNLLEQLFQDAGWIVERNGDNSVTVKGKDTDGDGRVDVDIEGTDEGANQAGNYVRLGGNVRDREDIPFEDQRGSSFDWRFAFAPEVLPPSGDGAGQAVCVAWIGGTEVATPPLPPLLPPEVVAGEWLNALLAAGLEAFPLPLDPTIIVVPVEQPTGLILGVSGFGCGVAGVHAQLTLPQLVTPCNPADIAPGFGDLNVNDVITFVNQFNEGCPQP